MTIEMLLPLSAAARPIVDRPGIPAAGFNFSKSVSTGATPIDVTDAASWSTPMGGAYAISGYARALTTGKRAYPVLPASAFNVGRGDFTLEIMKCLYTPGAGSGQMLMLTGGGRLSLQYLTAAYKNRMGISAAAADGGYYTFNLTRDDFLGVWRHLAVVREAGILRCYLDGIERGIATRDSDDFVLGGVPWPDDISSNTTLRINNATYSVDMFLAEIALYRTAIYTGNFTPTWPFVGL